MSKYRSNISSPHNNTTIVAALKNVPKAMRADHFFLPAATKPTPTIAPLAYANTNATKICGQPRTKPMKNANFTSPKPMPLPLVTKTNERKNAAAARAESKQ